MGRQYAYCLDAEESMIDLNGRVFVITGGNGGIGLGMAEGLKVL